MGRYRASSYLCNIERTPPLAPQLLLLHWISSCRRCLSNVIQTLQPWLWLSSWKKESSASSRTCVCIRCAWPREGVGDLRIVVRLQVPLDRIPRRVTDSHLTPAAECRATFWTGNHIKGRHAVQPQQREKTQGATSCAHALGGNAGAFHTNRCMRSCFLS